MKKLRIIVSLVCFSLLLLNFQCDEDDVKINPCDEYVILDNQTYATAESDFYAVLTATIEADCLEVSISASGCDPNNWELTLVDSENIAESMPPQRFLKLSLITNEACLAVFDKTESFDLKALRIDGMNEVVLNIENFPELLNYSY